MIYYAAARNIFFKNFLATPAHGRLDSDQVLESLANQGCLTHDASTDSFLPVSRMGVIVPVQFQSLELWRHALVASVRGEAPDLSARQMALMLSVYLGEGPHTVRGLAHILRISKPAVSRALDRLGELGYVRRERDELDRRNVLVQRTATGAEFLTSFSQLIDIAKSHVATIPARVIEFVTDAAPVVEDNRSSWAIEAAE